MQIIGFNFTKIHAEKSPTFKTKERNYNIEFTDFDKEKVDFLKDTEALNLAFRYSLTYGEPDENDKNKVKVKEAEVLFEGNIKVSASKEEARQFEKAWKKKQVPQAASIPLNNIILKRCTTKSVPLHDEIGLPDPHLRIPQLAPQEAPAQIQATANENTLESSQDPQQETNQYTVEETDKEPKED